MAIVTPCRICGNQEDNRPFVAREMMFGLRDEFEYTECAHCGSLSLREPPSDMTRYYPREYYSFSEPLPGRFRRWLKARRARHCLDTPSLLGKVLVRRFGTPAFADWMTRAAIHREDAILDVGCGAGHLLRELHDAGYSDLTGIDPFLPDDLPASPVALHRQEIGDVDRRFALVMLHHTFEHVINPRPTLDAVARSLEVGGCALIRTPIADSFAWRTYRADWVQLDAPRHIFVPTTRGMGHLAESCDLRLVDVVYDSTAVQFWASEERRRGIPLMDPASHAQRPAASRSERARLRQYAAAATRLNREMDGDQVCFYLRKP